VTGSPAIVLAKLEHDALTELLNIGVSYAAASLGKMIGHQVLLSVPAVSIITRERAAQIVGERENDKLVAVHQTFNGDISGRALLVFPEANSLALVRAVTGGDLPLEDIIELEQEALAETGNIILNGCLATIANHLRRSLKTSLPEIIRGGGSDVFGRLSGPGSEDAVLSFIINFSVKERDIRGYIVMLTDLPALTPLKGLLREFNQRMTGGALFTNHVEP
jgi:chemotaxis protein CheC